MKILVLQVFTLLILGLEISAQDEADSGRQIVIDPIMPPTRCEEGERADKCGCDLSCTNYWNSACRGICTEYERCFCIDGYVRETDELGSRCVPKDSCRIKDPCAGCDQSGDCFKKAALMRCLIGVPTCCGCEKTCDAPSCLPVCWREPQCLCSDGTYKDVNGLCVPYDQCNTDCEKRLQALPRGYCPSNEIPVCVGCQSTCKQPDCMKKSFREPTCVCAGDLVRGPDNKCIKRETCFQNDCERQRPFHTCPSTFEEAICVGCERYCYAPECSDRSYISPQCFCKPGYYRGPLGNCVKPNDCKITDCERRIPATSCLYPQIATCLGCEKNCDRPYDCDPVSYINPTCLCPPDLVKGPNGDCIKPDECRSCESQIPLVLCNKYEYPTCFGCENSCLPTPCFPQTFDSPQCFCMEGYVRDENNRCVPKSEFCPETCEDKLQYYPPCTTAGRELSCFACDVSCEQAAMGMACLPAIISEPRCFCKPGYLKLTNDADSICIPEDFCYKKRCGCRQLKAKKKECGCNEEAKCIGCDQPCAPVFKPCQEEYYPGGKCFCKEGFLRFYDGECRPADQCMLRG